MNGYNKFTSTRTTVIPNAAGRVEGTWALGWWPMGCLVIGYGEKLSLKFAED